ncbi:uncharacterized protein [Littorina saxatilis]|uniref:uncharacterized protein isoform X2 n=1 Tax=Littorina saxatilis TaxID=31220 RepID=UPI0038B6947D
MENIRLVHSLDRPNDLKTIVRQDLRDLGIKAPKIKSKKSKKLNQSRSSTQQDTFLVSATVFGNYLQFVPSRYVPDCGFVPRFLADAAEIIEEHTKVEGVFRKSGSINRQKELRRDIEEDKGLESSSVHDVTGLVKQFFRELPDPLFTATYHDYFVRCYHLPLQERVDALLLLCLLLPIEHLSTLRFTMGLLSRLADQSTYNKMDAGNLAVVLAPNIMHVNSRSQKMNSTEEKLLQIQTAIVELLIRNAERIGLVSNSLAERTSLLAECFGTEDELDGASDDNTLEDSKDKKRRKRSSSLQGLVSSIGRGLSRLRRNSEGKNNLTSGSNYSLPNESEIASQPQSQSLSVTTNQEDHIMLQPAATPVVRKRRISGEAVPFSATKRRAILDQLPYKSALGATPFTPASTKKRQPYGISLHSLKWHYTSSQVLKMGKVGGGGSGNMSCSNPLRKSSKTKHLFKRLSSSREKDDRDSTGDVLRDKLDSPTGVPYSNSAMELSSTDRSPSSSSHGITRTVSSPSLHDTSAHNHHGDITLNQGFIDADMTLSLDSDANTTHTSPSSPTRGRPLKRAESYRRSQKPVRRSASTDGQIRRGQPNKLCNGLMDGKHENVKNMRRSFDKSDISHPIPIIVAPLPEKPDSYREDVMRSRLAPERRHTVQVGAGQLRASSILANTSIAPDIMESSLLQVVLPPPSGFGDQSMMEVDIDHEEMESNAPGSDEESEAGFSTISGGTVIHNPAAQLQSLGKNGGGGSHHMAHYGSSVSVNAQAKALQPSTSVDSLISTGSETSAAWSSHPNRDLDRSVSIDSGKGSLLDCVEGKSAGGRVMNTTFVKSAEPDTYSLHSEDGTISDLHLHGSNHSIKSLSAEDLKCRPKEKPAARSHSMYVAGAGRHKNIVPNLQISAETHRLLTRAGFLDSSAPPNVKDVALPFKSPEKPDRSNQSFNRDDRLGRSLRLERSGASRKERPISQHTERVSPVKEESAADQAVEAVKNTVSTAKAISASAERREEGMEDEEEVWVRRDPVGSKTRLGNPEVSTETSETTSQDVPSSLNLKRAEMRMQKHDSVLDIRESNAGRVKENVRNINSSLEHSVLDQSCNNSSLHFPQSTTRKRGQSPIRIPTIFAKGPNNPTAEYYRELALNAHRKEGGRIFPQIRVNSPSEEGGMPEDQAPNCSSLQSQNSTGSGKEVRSSAGEAPKQRETGRSLLNSSNIDLSSSLMDTIEDAVTPRAKKRHSQQDVGRSPLHESTNTKVTISESAEKLQLRTAKGLTPHQVGRFGPKGSSSDRSPGKPVKRLQSPRSPHTRHSPRRQSPQNARERDAFRLESCHFHEQY